MLAQAPTTEPTSPDIPRPEPSTTDGVQYLTEYVVFVYDGLGKLIGEYSTDGPPAAPTVNYTATDPLGSPRVLTNKQGEVISRRDFMPFGEEIAPGAETHRTAAHKYGVGDGVRQKFTGYERDEETGLDFAEARYYYNNHGRFTAVDPLLASGKSADPQTFNRYAYTMNRPLILTDPTGLQAGTYYQDLGDGRWALANYAKKGYTRFKGPARIGRAPDGTRLQITTKGWRPADNVIAAKADQPRVMASGSGNNAINTPLLNDLAARGPALLKITTTLSALMVAPAAGPLLPAASSGGGTAAAALGSAPISVTGPATMASTFTIGTAATEMVEGDSNSSNEGTMTLFRGVAEGHPGFANALNGVVEPYGDHGDLDAHIMGSTGSGYTSWSMSRAIADQFAGPGGVVLTADIPASQTIVNQSDPFGEHEVFVRGRVSGAQVERRPR